MKPTLTLVTVLLISPFAPGGAAEDIAARLAQGHLSAAYCSASAEQRPKQVMAVYRTIIPVAAPHGSYTTVAFGGGYVGLAGNKTAKGGDQINFSIWGQDAAEVEPTDKKIGTIKMHQFTHEGADWAGRLAYPWKTGTRDQVFVYVKHENDQTVYTAWFGEEAKSERLLAGHIGRAGTHDLAQDEAWVNKPKVNYQTCDFHEKELVGWSRQRFDLVHLALQTDSTRVINLNIHSHIQPKIEGVHIKHHEASHHSQDATKVEQLAKVEETKYRVFNEFLTNEFLTNEFLTKMRGSSEGNESLLDHTMVLHGSNLGNASAHTSQNLPIIAAGGGFKHTGHMLYDRVKNRPLSNLFVRMLHQTGIKADKFGSNTGVLGELRSA